jgi:hypothetical protein
MNKTKESQLSKYSISWIYALFFLSGLPALIYQIVWQRSLFTFYGVNIQSITMIVADFMLGLGIGALVGAYLSKSKFTHHLCCIRTFSSDYRFHLTRSLKLGWFTHPKLVNRRFKRVNFFLTISTDHHHGCQPTNTN